MGGGNVTALYLLIGCPAWLSWAWMVVKRLVWQARESRSIQNRCVCQVLPSSLQSFCSNLLEFNKWIINRASCMSWPSDGGRVIAEATRQRVNPYTLSFSLAAKRSLDRAPASLCNPQTTSDKRASDSRGCVYCDRCWSKNKSNIDSLTHNTLQSYVCQTAFTSADQQRALLCVGLQVMILNQRRARPPLKIKIMCL